MIAKGQQFVKFPPVENLQVFTDRTLYIAGETVQFSAFVITDHRQQPVLSRILYAEIVSPNVHQVTGGKFPIVNQASDGSLVIPKNIITGIYYLRVYTKYMRNVGPRAYSYVRLKIVNPLRNEVMTGNDTSWNDKDENNTERGSETFIISLDKKKYTTRDSVFVSLKTNKLLMDTIQGLSISVVPEMSSFDDSFHFPAVNALIVNLRFYPETRGLSISGKLVDISDGKVVPDARVNLSIIGEGRDFMAIQTDSSGRFLFSPAAYSGDRDIFLSAKNTPDSSSEILVDNDFCTVPFQLPSPVFKLTPKERTLAYKMAVNTRIRESFNTDTLLSESETEVNNRAFYGTASDILVFDKYVELPTLEEYFNELPSLVKVRKKQGKKYFKVLGTRPEMLFYDPLILVDQVAVDDLAKVLAISPKDISRIEVVNEPYVKGNITYGGIISIISRQGDFAGIDLPESGVFIHFHFLTKSSQLVKSKTDSQNIPDARNTLCWKPNLRLIKGKTRFSFLSPDTPGYYQIIINGVSYDGHIFKQKVVFKVVQKKL